MSERLATIWLPSDEEGEALVEQARKLLIDRGGGVLARSAWSDAERVAEEIGADIGTQVGRAQIATRMTELLGVETKRVLGIKIAGPEKRADRKAQPGADYPGSKIGWAHLEVCRHERPGPGEVVEWIFETL